MLQELELTGYSIKNIGGRNYDDKQEEAYTKEPLATPFGFASSDASPSLLRRMEEIRQESAVNRGKAKLKRTESILHGLPEIEDPEHTMTVAHWLEYKGLPTFNMCIVGRQGNFLALCSDFS